MSNITIQWLILYNTEFIRYSSIAINSTAAKPP